MVTSPPAGERGLDHDAGIVAAAVVAAVPVMEMLPVPVAVTVAASTTERQRLFCRSRRRCQ